MIIVQQFVLRISPLIVLENASLEKWNHQISSINSAILKGFYREFSNHLDVFVPLFACETRSTRSNAFLSSSSNGPEVLQILVDALLKQVVTRTPAAEVLSPEVGAEK